MKWQVVIEKMNEIETREGSELDPISLLAAKAASRGQGTARINMLAKYSLPYGEASCSASVSIDCPQIEAYMDLAAEVAFIKAQEYVNDGFSLLVPEKQE